MSPILVWCDLETNGLDPYKHSILEVAVMKTELLNPFNAEVIENSVIWCHPDVSKTFDQFIVDMHTKNGLLKACADEELAMDLFEIEDALLLHVPEVANKEDKPILAGSSIHFDGEFIKVHMPRLAKRLSHRYYDVSALKLFCQSQGMEKFKKAEAHRALDDILESIQHAKDCKEWLIRNMNDHKFPPFQTVLP